MPFGAVTLIDNFNRTNESPIAAPWFNSVYAADGALTITSNALKYSTTGWGSAYYQGTYGVDPEMYVVIGTAGTGTDGLEIAVKIIDPDTATPDFYMVHIDGPTGSWQLYKSVNGTQTAIGSSVASPGTIAAGWHIGITVSGDTITSYYRTAINMPWNIVNQQTDTTFQTVAAGHVGVLMQHGNWTIDEIYAGIQLVEDLSTSFFGFVGKYSQLPLLDDFNRADNDTLGMYWTEGVFDYPTTTNIRVGSNGIVNNGVNSAKGSAYWTNLNGNHLAVSLKLSQIIDNGTTDGFGFVFRQTGADNGYRVAFGHNGSEAEVNVYQYTGSTQDVNLGGAMVGFDWDIDDEVGVEFHYIPGSDTVFFESYIRKSGGSWALAKTTILSRPTVVHAGPFYPGIVIGDTPGRVDDFRAADISYLVASSDPGTASSTSSPAFLNPTNVISSDDSYSTATVSLNGTDDADVRTSGYSFLNTETCKIKGILAVAEGNSSLNSGTHSVISNSSHLYINGLSQSVTAVATSTQNWPTTDTGICYGSPFNLWGETEIAPGDTNAYDFGAKLYVGIKSDGVTPTVCSIDKITMYIFYNEYETYPASFAGDYAQTITQTTQTLTWANPTNAGPLDSTTATTSLASASTTNTGYLQWQNWNWAGQPGGKFPAAAIITGMTASINAWSSHNTATNYVYDLASTAKGMTLLDASGNPIGPMKSYGSHWSDVAGSTVYYGGQYDNWGGVLTPALLNSTNFGLRFQTYIVSDGTTVTIDCDSITLNVFYTYRDSLTQPPRIVG